MNLKMKGCPKLEEENELRLSSLVLACRLSYLKVHSDLFEYVICATYNSLGVNGPLQNVFSNIMVNKQLILFNIA